MYYPDELIEEIRAKNNIVDVISGYVRLQKKGSNYFGLCPFHNEKSPSFSVSASKQMYYCFGCGAGGNVITFLMEYENYSFPEAVKALAERAGVALPEAEDSREMKKARSRRARLLAVNKDAATFFYYLLRDRKGSVGYQYLKNRQLSDETMQRFGLGYSGLGGGELIRYLRSKGYEESLIRDAGLGSIDERRGLSGKFWNRVMFPIQDINHRVIGFGGRVMGEGKPKYLNSPETEIFDKSRNLYGLNHARTSRKGSFILCEGYMDVIAMHQAGFDQAVASLGTAFTAGQASLLKRYSQEVLLSYDSDGAGVNAALRAIGILKEAGMTGKVISLTPYKDPDEFIKALGAEEFQKRLDNAENSFFFELEQLKKGYDLQDPQGKTEFHRSVARKLCEFSDELERENYIEAAAQRYQIGFENLRRLVGRYAAQTGLAQPVIRPKSGVAEKDTSREKRLYNEKLLLTWLADQPQLYPQIRRFISPADFSEGISRAAAQRLFADLEGGRANPAAVVSMFEDEAEQREAASLFQVRLPQADGPQGREKAFHEIVCALKRQSYERDCADMGTDVDALRRAVAGKKLLEELSKTHISLQ